MREWMTLLEDSATDHTVRLSEIVQHQRQMADDIGALKQDKAVRKVEDEHLEQRLDRIEASIRRVYQLGLWILGAFGSMAFGLAASFLKGVFFGP